MSRLTTIIIALLCSIELHAQFVVKHYGVDEGLPQTQVTAITEDAVGNLWLTTLGGGVTRFDGNTFNTYTTNEGLLHDFATDVIVRDGKVYIGSQKGVSVYDGINFTDHLVDQTGITSRLFFSGDTLLMIKPDYTVVTVDSSIARKKRSWTIIKAVATDVQHATLLVEEKGERKLVVYGSNGFRTMNVTGSFEQLLTSWSDNGKTFISTEKGVYTIDDGLKLYYATELPILGIDHITGHYFARKDKGVIAFSPDKKQEQVLIPETGIRCYFMDSQGHFWIGTNNGLFEIYAAPFQRIPQSDNVTGAPAEIAMSVERLDNKIYVGTMSKTMQVYNNEVLESEIEMPGILHTIHPHDGRLWLGTTGSLGWLTTGKSIQWVIKNVGAVVLGMDFDKSGKAMLATDEGMMLFDGKETLTRLDTTQVKFAWAVEYDKQKDLFYVGSQTGLYSLKDNVFTQMLSRDITVSSIEQQDDGTLLVGTIGKGVGLMKDGNITWIDRSKGLPSNTIFFATNFKNSIWVGTEKGISQATVNDNVVNVYNYNKREGLRYSEANLKAFTKTEDDLWVGLIGGVYHMKYPIAPGKKPLHVERVEVRSSDSLRRNIDVVDGQPVSLELDPNENYIAFYFNKVDRFLSKHYRYSYFLDGYDDIWSDMGSARVAVFNKLPPGKYTLKVVATDPTGDITYDDVKVDLVIHPKFYQTTFFKAASVGVGVIVLVLIVFGYNRYKISRQMRLLAIKENEKALLRKEISRDFHDELGNQAARMLSYIGLLRLKNNLDTNVYDSLNSYAQGILNGTRDFVWALDPLNDNLSNIIVHLKDFGEKLFNEKNVTFRFNGSLEENISLPMGNGRQINLIFKEAMTNAYKHASSTEVQFSVETNPDEIIISLRDFGVGVPMETVKRSERGLSNMQVRAKRIAGQISIGTADGGGTLVLFRMRRPGA